MNIHRAILLLLASVLSVNANPRFALVRVKEIYSAMPSTALLKQQVKEEHDAIMKDQRAELLRKLIGELQALQAQLADKTKTLDEESNRKLAQAYEIKRQEAQTLQQDFEAYKVEQEKAINKKMVVSMRASLNRIFETSNKLAKERGFDTVLDSSGSTNTGIPFVLYSKNAPDLTADVEAALKDSEANDAALQVPPTKPVLIPRKTN